VNFEDQKENWLPEKAFIVLRNANYQKFRELILEFLQSTKDEQKKINALYIFKKVN
jgi:hypothetical protein